MSLIDELRDVAKHFPPSHAPSLGELPGVVGALVALVEHGPTLLTDVEREFLSVAKFLGGVTDEPTPAADVPAADPQTIADLQAQNAALQDQLAAAVAVMNRTTVGEVTHDEVNGNGSSASAPNPSTPPVPDVS